MSGVDVLAVIRRHAESHRAMAESDAYSAQEAPRLEAALEYIAELIERTQALSDSVTFRIDDPRCELHCKLVDALAAVGPQS